MLFIISVWLFARSRERLDSMGEELKYGKSQICKSVNGASLVVTRMARFTASEGLTIDSLSARQTHSCKSCQINGFLLVL